VGADRQRVEFDGIGDAPVQRGTELLGALGRSLSVAESPVNRGFVGLVLLLCCWLDTAERAGVKVERPADVRP
jgi:hypothetical protein